MRSTKKQCHYLNLMFLNMSFSSYKVARSLFPLNKLCTNLRTDLDINKSNRKDKIQVKS